jgi:hypothetical protein
MAISTTCYCIARTRFSSAFYHCGQYELHVFTNHSGKWRMTTGSKWILKKAAALIVCSSCALKKLDADYTAIASLDAKQPLFI